MIESVKDDASKEAPSATRTIIHSAGHNIPHDASVVRDVVEFIREHSFG